MRVAVAVAFTIQQPVTVPAAPALGVLGDVLELQERLVMRIQVAEVVVLATMALALATAGQVS